MKNEFLRALARDTPAFKPEPRPIVIPAEASRIGSFSLQVLAGVTRRPVEFAEQQPQTSVEQ